MKNISKAAKALEGQKMFQILAEAKDLEKQGKEIIHFEIGDPDFKTPSNIIEKCVESLRNGETHYTKSTGLDSYIDASIKRSKMSRGFSPSPKQILVTAGANIQIYYALACITDPGDEVITVDPCFVSYKSIMKFLGINAKFIQLEEKNNFKLNPNDLDRLITSITRAILINSPHNPTGAVMSEDEIREIYDIAEKNDVYLLSDEVYGRMVYENNTNVKFFSPSSIDHCKVRTIIIHSLSKSYAMTGWRIGAATGPEEVIEKMALLLETTSSCVSPFIQNAAAEALSSDQYEIDAMINSLRIRRDKMVDLINKINNVSCITPDGAFYIFANIKKTGLTDVEFVDEMLKNVGVALCPGSFFGKSGEGYVRFCFANSLENIEKGLRKIINYFD